MFLLQKEHKVCHCNSARKKFTYISILYCITLKNIVSADLLCRCAILNLEETCGSMIKNSFRLSLDTVRKTFAEFTNEKCVCIYLVLLYGAFKDLIVVEKLMLFLIIKKQ